MASKLRKTFGDWRQPEIQALMKLIETQSKVTIAKWCIDYAERNILPIYEKITPNDFRPRITLDAAKAWLRGEKKLPEVKNIILNECHAAARESELNPAAQAAARAVGQAASCIHVATHALGIAFYGAAAIAYNTLGVNASLTEYNKAADKEFVKLYESLKAAAIPNEPNPVKVNWNC